MGQREKNTIMTTKSVTHCTDNRKSRPRLFPPHLLPVAKLILLFFTIVITGQSVHAKPQNLWNQLASYLQAGQLRPTSFTPTAITYNFTTSDGKFKISDSSPATSFSSGPTYINYGSQGGSPVLVALPYPTPQEVYTKNEAFKTYDLYPHKSLIPFGHPSGPQPLVPSKGIISPYPGNSIIPNGANFNSFANNINAYHLKPSSNKYPGNPFPPFYKQKYSHNNVRSRPPPLPPQLQAQKPTLLPNNHYPVKFPSRYFGGGPPFPTLGKQQPALIAVTVPITTQSPMAVTQFVEMQKSGATHKSSLYRRPIGVGMIQLVTTPKPQSWTQNVQTPPVGTMKPHIILVTKNKSAPNFIHMSNGSSYTRFPSFGGSAASPIRMLNTNKPTVAMNTNNFLYSQPSGESRPLKPGFSAGPTSINTKGPKTMRYNYPDPPTPPRIESMNTRYELPHYSNSSSSNHSTNEDAKIFWSKLVTSSKPLGAKQVTSRQKKKKAKTKNQARHIVKDKNNQILSPASITFNQKKRKKIKDYWNKEKSKRKPKKFTGVKQQEMSGSQVATITNEFRPSFQIHSVEESATTGVKSYISVFPEKPGQKITSSEERQRNGKALMYSPATGRFQASEAKPFPTYHSGFYPMQYLQVLDQQKKMGNHDAATATSSSNFAHSTQNAKKRPKLFPRNNPWGGWSKNQDIIYGLGPHQSVLIPFDGSTNDFLTKVDPQSLLGTGMDEMNFQTPANHSSLWQKLDLSQDQFTSSSGGGSSNDLGNTNANATQGSLHSMGHAGKDSGITLSGSKEPLSCDKFHRLGFCPVTSHYPE